MGARGRMRGCVREDTIVTPYPLRRGTRGYVDVRGRIRGCAREDAWVRKGGYVGVVAGMRKLWRIRRRSGGSGTYGHEK